MANLSLTILINYILIWKRVNANGLTTSSNIFAFTFNIFGCYFKGRDEIFQKWLWWGDGKFLLNMGEGARNGGGEVGFKMGGWEILKLSPPILPTPVPFFSNFVQTHPHCSFHCPVSLAEWVIMPQLMCYFT